MYCTLDSRCNTKTWHNTYNLAKSYWSPSVTSNQTDFRYVSFCVWSINASVQLARVLAFVYPENVSDCRHPGVKLSGPGRSWPSPACAGVECQQRSRSHPHPQWAAIKMLKLWRYTHPSPLTLASDIILINLFTDKCNQMNRTFWNIICHFYLCYH